MVELNSRTHLLEREAELGQIDGALRDAAAGAGGFVVIEGAPGIGKSSLMGEAAELADAGGMTVLRARGGVMEHEFALGVVIGLLAPSIEPLAARERELVFAGAAGLARPLFEAVPDRAAADDRLFARFHGLHWLCARLAEVRPLALLVDDAHWADEQSLRFLAYLEARIEEIPACAILAVRTGETAAAPDALTRLIEREPRTAIRPAPLSPAAVAALVRGSLGEETGDEVCVECARTTGGNPLLARQLIAAVRERRWQPASLDAAAIAAMGPPSVARFVAARLRRRSPTVVSVARALAILGDDASLVDTAEVAGTDRKVAADAVDALIDAELLHPHLPPSFVHPIIQQALHDSIPPAERAQLHLAAAHTLARDPARSERAAAHLLAVGSAGPVGEEWAFDALTAAARRAGDRGSADHAVRFLRRALEEEASAAMRRSVLLELGAAESAARLPEATGRMEEAQRLSSNPAERAHAALGLSMVCFVAAELPQAVAACEDVLATAPELDRELRLGLEFQAAATRLVGGLPSAETFGRLLALEPEVRRGQTAAERSLLALIALVFAATTAHPSVEVAALGEAAWGDGQLLVEIRTRHSALAAAATSIALTAAPTAIALAGRLNRAIEIWTAGVEEGQARSSMLLYSSSLGTRASAREWTGDLGGAEADAIEALALLPADDPIIRPSALSALVDVHIERGALEQAAAVVRDAWPTGELPLSLSISQALASRGRLALQTGDPAAALSDFEEAGRRAAALAYLNPCALMWRSYAGLALARLGERDRARELVEEELAIARRFGAPEPIGEALRVHALLAPNEDMVELAGEAAEVLAGSDLRLAHARALIDLGAALRRGGHRRDARAPLREGLDLANRCGSLLETDRAMDELRATGARPRRPALRGVDSLSAQERRVATMATTGLTNREIAEALFLTRRTVEMHLTGAYRKLDVSGRAELSGALAGHGRR
ncbi:MAG TPA: AAA family ATPase [Solirubrobacteraceae bacterium]|nr:AAA family ATPase [Solirubrobacteraceae bacterium]